MICFMSSSQSIDDIVILDHLWSDVTCAAGLGGATRCSRSVGVMGLSISSQSNPALSVSLRSSLRTCGEPLAIARVKQLARWHWLGVRGHDEALAKTSYSTVVGKRKLISMFLDYACSNN